VAILVLSAGVCALLVGYAVWYTRRYGVDRTVVAFGVLLGGMAIYSFSRGMQLGYTTRPEKLLWARLLYIGFAPGVGAWFVFCIEYNATAPRLGRRSLSAIAIFVVCTAIAGLTNPYHELVWSRDPDATVITGETLVTLDRAFGPLFFVIVFVSYMLYVIGFISVLRTAIGDKSLFLGQALAIGIGSVIPIATALPYIFGVSPGGIDFTPASYAIAGIAFAYAIFRHRMLDLKPVARDRVISSMRDGFVVLDRRDQIVDHNAAAAQFLDTEQLLGTRLSELLSTDELAPESAGENKTVGVFRTDTGRFIEVDRSPLGHGRETGELVMFRDITERKQREQLRQQRNERLEQFAGIVSHDLRNPLTVANSRLALARQDTDSEHLDHIEDALARMETIVEETLALAREGQTVADPEPVDVTALVERSWDGVETGRGSLQVEDSLWVEADPDRLQQVFENLFRNAVEHTSTANARITVRVGRLSNGFYVEDDGPGIDPSIREELFDPGVTTAEDGSGFGLAIISDIVAAHGWQITATEGTDGGARFEITGVQFAKPVQ
jgi:PAS domain S-box-containing protein